MTSLKPAILFLCTGNSCRSQMAEGFARTLLGERVRAYSAGVETHGLNPTAVAVMAEAGVDIRCQESQHIDEFEDLRPTLVVTVCDSAAERCPVWLNGPTLHHSFSDPAKAEGTEGEILDEFRRVRDEIKAFVETLPERIAPKALSGTIQPWEREPEGPADDYGVFRIQRFLARSPRTGSKRPFSVVETADWVNVIALTPESDVVLVRQYRHGTRAISLEIPGGMVDAGEDPAVAAARELREETGYEGDLPEFLGTLEPNPAFLDNHCHTYLIRNAKLVGDLVLDPGEDIEVALAPLSSIPGRIQSGEITHAVVVCAFWWLEHGPGEASSIPS